MHVFNNVIANYASTFNNKAIPENDGKALNGDRTSSQQDGAPVHTSHLVQNWLYDNVDMFWFKDFWPANPDLNPLDYYM